MKPRLLAFGLALGIFAALPLWALGQTLGMEAGANFADLTGNNVDSFVDSRLGLVGGGFLRLPLTQALALQPEILYEQKGADTSSGGEAGYRLDYVEVPVLLEVNLGFPVVGPGILLGPAFDINVFSSGLTNKANPADAGLIGGLQVHLDPWVLSGRYEMGLTSVTSNQNLQNGTLTFLVGLMFV